MKTGKLFKHEFRGLMRWILPLAATVLAVGILASAMTALFDVTIHNDDYTKPLLTTSLLSISMITIFICMAAVAAAVACSEVLIAVRYYRTVIGQQSYLTHTLPVTADGILVSKILVSLAARLIVAAAVAICGGMVVLTFSVLESAEPLRDIIEIFTSLFETIFTESNALVYTVSAVLNALTALVASPVLIFACITIGGNVARKHRVVASIGIYLGVTFVISFVTNMIKLVGSVIASADAAVIEQSFAVVLSVPNFVGAVLNIGVIVGGYFLMRHILTKKLNV